MTNKCTIISHIIPLLHVSTLSCHPQVKVKVTCHPCNRHWDSVQAERSIGGVEVYLYSFMTNGLEVGEGFTPRPLFTPGMNRYPLYKRLGWPQGRCGQVRKIPPVPGLDPRTVQPVANRYTDWATQPTIIRDSINISEIQHLYIHLMKYICITHCIHSQHTEWLHENCSNKMILENFVVNRTNLMFLRFYNIEISMTTVWELA
jgi:hypothetical protein